MKRDAAGKFVNNWDSETKQRFSLSLTSTAWRSLDEEAQKRGISRSEVIEHLARSLGNQRHLDTDAQIIATLQRQKQELEALLENAPDAIARFDSQIRYLYANRVVEQVLGLSRDALLGKSMSEFMSDPIYLFWEEHLRQVFATAQDQEIEFEFATPFGIRYYQARLVPELDAEKTPVSVIVISRDITETKQVEQQRTQSIAAQETERQVTAILENITDAFVAFDRNWYYTYVNQAAAEILNKTPAELIGKHVWHEVFPELVGGLAYQEFHRAVAQQVPVAWEEFGPAVPRWLEVNAYPSAEGVAVYFRDITERKQAEAEREQLLRERETERAQFEAVLQQLPAGVLIADAASNKLVLANEQAKLLVGYGYEQLLELEEYESVTPFVAFRADGQIYAPEDYPLGRSLRTGEVVSNEEMELHRSDGSQIFVNINSAPILDHQNQIIAAVVVFQDITARKQTEVALQQQAEALANQQKWLETVLDLMPTPTIFMEPGTGKVTFSNRIANELAGGDLPKHKPYEEYSDTYYCTDANGDRVPTDKMPAVLIARGEPLENHEINWHTPDGMRSLLCWGEVLPAMYGHPATCIVMFQDVTRLKQIEENLRQTEERLQLALSSAQMIAWDMDLTKNYVVCSPNAAEIWGFQEGTAEDFFADIHPDDRQVLIAAVQWAIAGEKCYSQEYRVTDLVGATRWINSQGQVYLDATGRGIRVIGVSVDITERKLMEAERDRLLQREQAARRLAESERQRLHEILMQLPALIAIVTGPDLVYEFANPTYLQVTGRTSDIIGQSMRDVFPELEGQIYFDVLNRVYQTGDLFIQDDSLVYWDRNGDGVLEEAFFNCVFPAWRDAEGTIQGVLMHGIEVTAQVRARQQIEQLLEEVQHKERQQKFLIELNDAIRAIQDSQEIMWQVVSATGQHFQVTRCTYGEIDPTQEYVIVDRDYCNGVLSVAGSHHMDSFGSQIIAELKQGKTIVVDDVDTDPRTAGSGAANFNAIQTKSLLCVPLVKAGQFVGLFVLHHVSPRRWTEEDVTLMERIAQKTWLAVERSRAEEELRESKARLQLALMVGRMGTWDWDMQMNTVSWSEGNFDILGLQPNECKPTYELWLKSIYPDDLAQTEMAIQQAMLKRTEYHHEYRTLWANGSIRWTEARGQFTYNTEGQPTRMIGILIDITQRKQAEQEREQLLEREQIARTQVEAAQRQLANIFETSPVGIALLDAHQRFVAINEALAQINGLNREQHLGHSIPELFGQSDPHLVEVFQEIYTTGQPFISPSFAVNVPGRSDRRPGYYNVYYLPTVNSNHQIEDVLVYVVDVTEQVQLECAQCFLSEASAVLASSLDYQTTLERVAQLTVPLLADWCTVHIVEEDGAIEQIAIAHTDLAKLQWAEQLRDKYPLDTKGLRGAALTLRTGKSDLLADIPDELLVQAAVDSEHLEILREVGFKSVMTVPLRTQSRILGVISFISAESGRRYDSVDLQLAEELARRASLAIDNAQLYRQAQRDRAKAESANRVKDEFLAVLSHELRSPLNPIMGWTQMLRSKRLDATKVDKALETIERNAKLQAQLIEDLLDVSRILQGKMTLNVAPVNLAVTIEAALETVRLAAEAKSIHIQTTFNPICGTVVGDANRLQQVIWNLLSNAVKFTPSGGRVEVQLSQLDSYAQIKVKDTGKGISPEFLPHVFEYFQQEDGTTTRQFGGLGLGLAIVRHFTELHGGTVHADSPGQNLGATFSVRLPLNLVEQELPTDDSHPKSVAHLTGIQILVVDDDADMRELAAFILTESGADVTTAASAAQALALLNQYVPNLLLCDIGMPEMDGYFLIRQIRRWAPEQGGTIPAIALTAYAGEINQQQALAAGFQVHISKPVDPEKLVQTIVQLLRPMG
ncbi:putative two component hybrid sensor regulator [Cylindrospermum sp. NIES-4074]|nr:putative two component hybrid sensor regulator [Cylindrospermum sp. NIES-4074]